MEQPSPNATQPSATRRGVVVDFDEPVGLGTVREEAPEEGGAEHPFHCTAIADGSRDIAVGTVVTFRLAHGRRGRLEATDVQPVRPVT